MAFFNSELKAEKAPAIKALAKEYGVKLTLSVQNHMVFVCTIRSSNIDFHVDPDRGYDVVSHYHLEKHYQGRALEFLQKLYALMMQGNHNNSDPMTDYFDVGWYVEITVGDWKKPYSLEVE